MILGDHFHQKRYRNFKNLMINSSVGADESAEQMPPANQATIRQLLGETVAANDAQETLVRASTLPWTVLRPAGLNFEPSGASLKAVLPPDPVDLSKTISRADVAAFALHVIETQTYSRQAVALTA